MKECFHCILGFLQYKQLLFSDNRLVMMKNEKPIHNQGHKYLLYKIVYFVGTRPSKKSLTTTEHNFCYFGEIKVAHYTVFTLTLFTLEYSWKCLHTPIAMNYLVIQLNVTTLKIRGGFINCAETLQNPSHASFPKTK